MIAGLMLAAHGTSRQLSLWLCAVLLLCTSALAQKQDDLAHYVGAVPRTPADYRPITAEQRATWFVRTTVGPATLLGGIISAGWGTAFDRPPEYGPHWEGFGQRYGMRLTGISVGNATESTLGSAWGEDPRYFHTVHKPFGERTKNIVDLTFRAYRPDGQRHLAYARYVAIVGNNFLSNTWRAQSEADWNHALIRSAEGIGARAISNAVSEFLPELWKRMRHKPAEDVVPPTQAGE